MRMSEVDGRMEVVKARPEQRVNAIRQDEYDCVHE